MEGARAALTGHPMNARPIHLIETMRVAPGGAIALLDLHLRRLRRSCAALGVPWPDRLAHAIAQHVRTLDARHTWRLRLLLSPTGAHSLQSQILAATPTPVRVVLAHEVLRADAHWLGHKTTHRPWYAHAQQWLAAHPEVFDVLYCNAENEVCEGSRSNVYLATGDGTWLSPPVRCGLLAGVQRQALLDQGLVQEAVITRAQLCQAQRIRVSNALRGWMDAEIAATPLFPPTSPRSI